jgi:GDP-L-fucose synthase
MKKNSKIYLAGHQGMVGSAIYRKLQEQGYDNICFATSSEVDLRDSAAVDSFFSENEPEFVFMAAAKVGGILANNNYPADFLYDNLMVQNNVIECAYRYNVEKLLFLGSSCIYPKLAPQPIAEESLLSGYLEPTNEAYAIAKIAGIKLCQAYFKQHGCRFVSAMPTNLYGIGDNYHPENSHVLPALIRRIHEAKEGDLDEVVIWGTGTPLREFMFADDLGAACVFLMQQYDEKEIINVGSGEEISILNLARLVANVVGFRGRIATDTSKPDGTPRKLMDSSRLRQLGFRNRTSLSEGIPVAYEDFLNKTSVVAK